MSDKCPVCESKLKSWVRSPHGRDGNAYDCPNCGMFFASRTALSMLPRITDWEKAGLSHQMFKSRTNPDTFQLNSRNVNQIHLEDLPGPDEQLENLIHFWGEEQGHQLACDLSYSWSDLRAKLGAVTAHDVDFVAEEAIKRELLKGSSSDRSVDGILTFKGWEEYRRIDRGITESTHAFMAMPFGDQTLDTMLNEAFRPAVHETGFTLKRLDDAPGAGVIDNRMRVEIRLCKFLIAELTHCNRGAYWEAGYAEGLGKPVIYTCEKSYFEDKQKGTHFDTNHCTTVVWEAAKPEKAKQDLMATIRATFPFEAKMPREE